MATQVNGTQLDGNHTNGTSVDGTDVNGNTIQTDEPSLVFILDQPRTRSHLFHRFLSTHPDLKPHWHPMVKGAWMGPERHQLLARNTPARRDQVLNPKLHYPSATYASCAAALQETVELARQTHTTLLINEHCLGLLPHSLLFPLVRGEPLPTHPSQLHNPTVLTDDVYASMKPILLIRHPYATVRSTHVAAQKHTLMTPADEDFANMVSLSFSRFLFTHLRAQNRQPLVVDGDDVVFRTETVKQAVCAYLSLDPAGVSETWEAMGTWEEEEDVRMFGGIGSQVMRGFLGEIVDSTGIKRPERKGGGQKGFIDVEAEVEGWKREFGEEVAGQLRGRAEEVMGDYEFLRGFKV